MSNGIIPFKVRTRRGVETVEYQMGELALLSWLERYGITSTQDELRGDDPTKPALIIEGHTTKRGHEFRFVIEFRYDPNADVRDGVPYGFHFVGGAVRLTTPQPGATGEQTVRTFHDFESVIRDGEAQFVRGRHFAVRATAAVDQAAAEIRERGGLR
ncbi:hypothetical protein BJF79_03390 [Actinomadura sp. CNU-125]|uniref:hypothetical protein n=1 Tax=Actinomadura sp. CNU-125 TaxID=1904961 RepID=UPI000961B634|nr:hypothetical protein [Actinomadura sp. CNU-125]OLT12957.1 hypothetical protein BJF79_03390 [Actinomadura sp. CNU-125]